MPMSFLDITHDNEIFLFTFCALQARIIEQPHHMLLEAADGPCTFEP